MARRLCMARRRHLAVLQTAARHRHADRPRVAALAGTGGFGSAASRSPQPAASPSSIASSRPQTGVAAPLFRALLPSLCWLRSRSGTQPPSGGNICMSLPAGAMISLTALSRPSTRCGRVTARRARFRRSISSPATTRTCCARANCCATSICPRQRARASASPSAAPR